MADVLNTWSGGDNSLATSLTVALTGQTAGNLIAGCFFYTENSEPPTPAGYTSIAWGSIGGGTSKGFKLFWKVATGTDDAAFDWTIEGSKLASCVIQEFDLQSAVLDDFFLDETNENTSAKPMPCGTATPVAATSLAVAFLGVRNNAAGWPHGTTTAPTGYDDLQAYGASNASRPTTAMASKAVSGTADESPEFSTTDTGSRGYGGIAIFSGGVASNTLGITTEPEEWQQRNATTRNATASVAGTWTGTIPASIQWRAINSVSLTEIVTWNSVGMDAPDGGGTWSGDVTIDDDVTAAGEAITLQFRYSDDTGVTAESAVDWRIVRFVDILGQSNASRWGDRGTALTPDDDAWQYTLSGYAALSTTGDGNTQLANTLIAADGVPTVIRNYAVGGRGLHPSSDSTRWLSTAGGSPWKLFETGFTNSVAASEALVWVQGERDGQPTHTSYADYLAGLGTLFTRYRAALSNGSGEAQIPIVIGYIGNNSAGAGNHDEWADIRRAQQDYVASDANCYGMAYYDLSMEDSIHLDAAGFADLAERCANIFKQLNGDATYSAMPFVASATATALDTIDIAITHDGGTDFTPTTAITDFEVSDDDWVTDISLSSAVRLDANTIRLTLSRDYVGSFKVRYNYGAVYSVTGPVQDNSALTLPLDYVDSMDGAAGFVSSDMQALYGIKEIVSGDSQSLWNIAEAVSSESQAIWNIREFVSSDAQLSWNLKQLVAGNSQLLWDILSSATVGANLQVLYHLAESVSADADTPWNIAELIASDEQLSWNIADLVTSDASIPFQIKELIGANSQILWDIIQSGIVNSDLGVPYNITEFVSSDADIPWNIKGIANADSQLPWQILSAVAQDAELLYSLMESVSSDMAARWDITGIAASSIDLRWKILGEITDRVLKTDGGNTLIRLMQKNTLIFIDKKDTVH